MAGAVAGLLSLTVAVIVLAGVLGGAVADRPDRRRLRGREARPRGPHRAHPVPRRRPARRVGVVPRDPQQPPPVLPVLRRAGGVEPGDDRARSSGSAGALDLDRLAIVLAWASVAGSALQVAVQLPIVLRLLRAFTPSLDVTSVARPRRHPQLLAGALQPRRRADQRLHRPVRRQPAADRRGHRPGQRAAALHAAGQPVRHVGVGGRAAGDVAGGRRGGGGGGAPARRGSPAASSRWRSSSSRRRWRSPRSATWWRARSCRPAASATKTRCTCGASWRGRRSACSRPRSRGSTRRRSGRCATRARRCATRWCAWRSPRCSGTMAALVAAGAARDRPRGGARPALTAFSGAGGVRRVPAAAPRAVAPRRRGGPAPPVPGAAVARRGGRRGGGVAREAGAATRRAARARRSRRSPRSVSPISGSARRSASRRPGASGPGSPG